MDALDLLMEKALRAVKALRLSGLSVAGTTHPFNEYFPGFGRVEAVRRIFGERTEEVLNNLKVDFVLVGDYMWVNGANGHLMINPKYLNNGGKTDIYLDIIHELVHVKQYMDGRELFDSHYSYPERPTEIEAYRITVEEARRLGLGEDRIFEYLRTEWMSEEELEKLAAAVNVRRARS